MNGMMIECLECQHLELITFQDDTAKQVEDVVKDGWRFAPDPAGYICPYCMEQRKPHIYKRVKGQPKVVSRVETIKHLTFEVAKTMIESRLDNAEVVGSV